MRPIRFLPVSLLVLLLPACEGYRTVAGRVHDGAGNPIPRASIRSSDFLTDSVGSIADEDGRFSITVFTSAFSPRASVGVSAPGYHPRWTRLPFREDVEVELTPETLPAPYGKWSSPELVPTGGVHYGAPLRFSTAFGAMRVRFYRDTGFQGWVATGEGGDGGVKGRLGYVYYVQPFGGQLSVSAIRTSHKAWSVGPNQTFVGGEARVMAFMLSLTGGYYARVSGTAPGDSRLVSLGVGLGL